MLAVNRENLKITFSGKEYSSQSVIRQHLSNRGCCESNICLASLQELIWIIKVADGWCEHTNTEWVQMFHKLKEWKQNEDTVLHPAVDVWAKSHTNTDYFK